MRWSIQGLSITEGPQWAWHVMVCMVVIEGWKE